MRSFALALALPCLAWMAGAAEPAAAPQVPLAAALQARIDRAATLVLKDTGVPSTSIAVVKDGQIAYVRAYGLARL
jgi:CubicO group peptidase (beta-lactamase class C family)